ncbi:similar to Saccharomyces cerevisiae YLR345W Similar to 6-phosphofructo-2-kinase/fructose-2,6-bisphosphatase enzymes responsible for the metabolism of fructoso-2,6-bisphosphate [Maudiozyma barnettii]|uniref:Similar to Saccharomyces cerevisiae YLR345W Similar to 6-phosphofructo-2-kinase/fructose-2,6-bisphosphatase enzymes responsible for the metabolism of fructoso-2,6-bisphosphate n=1 Tax=Maudiozyma barnettii TaxID=61262 RepID=A0A8H2ZKT7_9SACH|nr:bifunctional fructose-2,6-bisphosphate 2-phosphatase/6-phosphofructo-2-kinase [Kazachstania barnettii]CAB4257298.1 similar to Saccharomyces cerevisiae YLR345W Similar to 6-phosphofructo-2-kinase/fructose-2,6-bisphosphatase enzymes responsible for the metabolism of fructoso-2,6-bisphosphate [Kazachstania barnettii]CAD1784563.1 similar to Saccharomyces cerevisiae YLR345W Similar to 6-phosphofructo-2-kinase/fructose-2,6-bisphosphatase enzymes responsible for the metabolism of fructoso-2,6-bisphos
MTSSNILLDHQDAKQDVENNTNYMARTTKRWVEPGMRLSPKHSNNGDSVHEPVFDVEDFISPGQLYSTESGCLFHAGRILIVLVGLPATSKTLLSVAITRYTRWLGVRTESFHLSKYTKANTNIPSFLSDEFSTVAGAEFKEEIISKVTEDMMKFFDNGKGQIAIYDALNIRKSERANIKKTFEKNNVKVLFVESIVTDPNLITKNIELAIQSEDYKSWGKHEAIKDYTKRITENESLYERMSPIEGVSYIKYLNFGERIIMNNTNYGYLVNKIVFFLMNLSNKQGCVYLSRCGRSNSDKYIDDEVLNEEGLRFSKKLTKIVIDRVKEKRLERKAKAMEFNKNSKDTSVTADTSEENSENLEPNSLAVWTAERKRTYDTAMFFKKHGFDVRKRSQLKQLHPGVVADMTFDEIEEKYPKEYEEYLRDPYHYRFSRAESYHDLAVRMEPLLLELEHMHNDILIIAHESTLRVLYGYFMACTSLEVPTMDFTRNQLVEISFNPFNNVVTRIPIDI